MTQTLVNFLNGAKNKDFAIQQGTHVHELLRRVIIDNVVHVGDSDIIKNIEKHPELVPFFASNAQTEVPIAGVINGVFISRRIDRLLINHDTKTIDFIDYKTDINKTEFIEKYKHQLKEYAQLLHSAYPDYKVNGYILWLHDWELSWVV